MLVLLFQPSKARSIHSVQRRASINFQGVSFNFLALFRGRPQAMISPFHWLVWFCIGVSIMLITGVFCSVGNAEAKILNRVSENEGTNSNSR